MEKKLYYWVMRDGSEILVNDMGDRHLENTIKMIIENRWKGDKKYWLPILNNEYDYRKIIYRKEKILKIINKIN